MTRKWGWGRADPQRVPIFPISPTLRDRLTLCVVPALGAMTLGAAMWFFAPRGATATVETPTKASSRSMLPPAAHRRGWFVVRSDASSGEAGVVGDWLESVAEVFLTDVRELGFSPKVPDAPLEFVYFADREDFLVFADETDGIDATAMGGYYAPGPNRAVVYDDRSTRSFADAMASSDPYERASAQREASTATRRKIAHEAAHLLAFNTGVQQRGVEYPMWFTEGLAERIAALAMGESPERGPFRPGLMDAISTFGSIEARYTAAHAAFESLIARGPRAAADYEASLRAAGAETRLAEATEPD